MNRVFRSENSSRILVRIVDYELFILLLAAPGIIFPGPVTAAILLAMLSLMLIRKWISGHFIFASPVDWPLLLFLVMVLVSLYATFDMELSGPRVAGIIYGVAIYYSTAASTSQSKRRLTLGVVVLLFCGFAVAIISLLGTSWTSKVPELAAITARLPQAIQLDAAPRGFSPNQVAGTLLWVTPLYFSLAVVGLVETKGLLRGEGFTRIAVVFVWAGMLVVLVTILLTQSRSGLLGLALALVFMLVIARQRYRSVVVLVALSLAIVFSILWLRPLRSGQADTADPEQADLFGGALDNGPTSLESLDGRMEIWKRALYGLEDFPFTGMGVGTFRRVVPVLYPLFLISPQADIAHAHNHLLQAGLDLGLPGLIAYIAIWLGVGVMLWRSWLLRRDRWEAGIICGLCGGMVAYAAYGMLDVVALGAKPGFIFWLLLGIIVGAHDLISRRARSAL